MPFQQQVEKSRSFTKKLFANLQNRAKLQLSPILFFLMFYSLTTPMFVLLVLHYSCALLLLCFIILVCFVILTCFITFSNLFHLKLSSKYVFGRYFATPLCFVVPMFHCSLCFMMLILVLPPFFLGFGAWHKGLGVLELWSCKFGGSWK